MSIFDVIGITALGLLCVILFLCAYDEIVSYRRIRKNMGVINGNLSKRGYTLQQDGLMFHYVGNRSISRALYPSEVFTVWEKYQDDFESFMLEK